MKSRFLVAGIVTAMMIFSIALPLFAKDLPKPFISDPKASEVKIDMKAFAFGYDPNDVTVYEGQKITIVITSTDIHHNFTLAAFNINVSLDKNTPTTVTFVADKVGEFLFKCNIPLHFKMKGVLKVLPKM